MDSEGPRGPDLVPTAADWSAWAAIIVYHTLWPGIGPLCGLQGAPRGLVLAQNASFGGLAGTRRAPGSQIWSQLPLAAAHKLDSW